MESLCDAARLRMEEVVAELQLFVTDELLPVVDHAETTCAAQSFSQSSEDDVSEELPLPEAVLRTILGPGWAPETTMLSHPVSCGVHDAMEVCGEQEQDDHHDVTTASSRPDAAPPRGPPLRAAPVHFTHLSEVFAGTDELFNDAARKIQRAWRTAKRWRRLVHQICVGANLLQRGAGFETRPPNGHGGLLRRRLLQLGFGSWFRQAARVRLARFVTDEFLPQQRAAEFREGFYRRNGFLGWRKVVRRRRAVERQCRKGLKVALSSNGADGAGKPTGAFIFD